MATDSVGNMFVMNVFAGAIDVFDPDGYFLTELPASGMEDIAIDSQGYLYVYGFQSEAVVLRYDPDPELYDPSIGQIAYEEPLKVLDSSSVPGLTLQSNSIALDEGDHLYIALFTHISEYGSASENNILIEDTIGSGVLKENRWVTVDKRNGNIYASDVETPGGPSIIRVFDGGSTNKPYLRKITGFGEEGGRITAAIDEETGHVFVDDLITREKVYEFEESSKDQKTSESIGVIKHSFKGIFKARISIDNWENSPNRGYLFVPSHSKTSDHLYAFEPMPVPEPPDIESVEVSNVTRTQARLTAVVNPGNVGTDYRFEYVGEKEFEEGEFSGAGVISGEIAAGNQPVSVSAGISGLSPGIAYYVRIVAENHCKPEEPEELCVDEAETRFKTYPPLPSTPVCANDEVRSGMSGHLPDCRAYELATPPNTGGRHPESIGGGSGDLFGTYTASPDGNSISFVVGGGGIPGLGGTGAVFGDGYVAERKIDGWQTRLAEPNGNESSSALLGGLSPDHLFAAWRSNTIDVGELTIQNTPVHYVRYPDGSHRLAGLGSLGADPIAVVKSITTAGSHIIFETRAGTAVPLEPGAPDAGTAAIYDRTDDETTHVVSLLPGGWTPEPGEGALYEGSSADGTAIAFKLGNVSTSPLYLRINNSETQVVNEEKGAEFSGLSSGGRYLFYALEGDLFRFDSQGGTDQIAAGPDALFVNVSEDGSHAYFVSPSLLTGEEENEEGDKAVAGHQNLYVWDGATTRFVATVTNRDVEGELDAHNVSSDGLGLWTKLSREGELARAASRTTSDGTVLLFESRAVLTGYEAGGKAQIYRFDTGNGQLDCLSCLPTETPPAGDAALQVVGVEGEEEPIRYYSRIPNLSDDGGRAFFESLDPLVLGDTDGLRDIYEWEEEGIGTCDEAGGCVYLISSGQSSRPNYLYGVSADGKDVFFSTADLLVKGDRDSTPSIYDARIEGGFPEAQELPCVAEACRPSATPAPSLPPQVSGSSGNAEGYVRKHRKCPKGKRKVVKKGKLRCIKGKKAASHHKNEKHRYHRGEA